MGIDPDIVKSIIQSLSFAKSILMVSLPVLCAVKFCEQAGFFRYFDRFSQVVVSYTFFQAVTGKAFLANLGSVYAGSALLMEKYENREISRANLILSVIFSGFLPRIRVLFTYTLPIVFPLLTLPVAMFYAGFFLTIAIARLVISAILSRYLQCQEKTPLTKGTPVCQTRPSGHKSFIRYNVVEAAGVSIIWSAKLGVKIVIHILLISSLFTYMQFKGIFSYIPLNLSWFGLPEASISAFYAYIANTYSGMAIIGSFLSSGQINSVEGIKLLLFCTMASYPIMALKEAPSYYFGIYGLNNGLILILFDTVLITTLGVSIFMTLTLF